MVSIEEWLVKELTKRNASITTAESCTGGLLSGRIVNVGGASEVFNQSFVTYSDDAKNRLLGVKQETLDRVGAVHRLVDICVASLVEGVLDDLPHEGSVVNH